MNRNVNEDTSLIVAQVPVSDPLKYWGQACKMQFEFKFGSSEDGERA